MTLDICIVTYNSEKWLAPCVKALASSGYNLKNVALYFADNASSDGSVRQLYALKEKHGAAFAAFDIAELPENLGFGAANNMAAKQGAGEYVFFLNPDTEIFPDALERLAAAIERAPDKAAGFELRQFPYEHPKYYNPATLTTSWASGACFVLRRCVFSEAGGFDESMFLYAEDVELSWHVRALGYKIYYVPDAVVYHYAYGEAGEVKPAQVAGSAVGNLVLRMKYGTEKDMNWWESYFETEQSRLYKTEGVQPLIEAGIKRAKQHRHAYRAFYNDIVRENLVFKPKFLGLDYEFARAGAFYENRLPKTQPRFSVLVRTYQRPELLALTLKSLTWQTYPHFEVLVVEDGEEPLAQQTVEGMQGRLDIRYIHAGEQVGRCKAGNMAIEAAKGDYLCFLDDDDYFYPEHLEVMACQIEENPDCRLFVAGAVEAACEPLNMHCTRWMVTEMANIAHKRVTFATLCYGNPFPIQAAVFHKSLPQQAGGLPPELDAFEDWDMWIRFGMHTPVAAVEKATSFYKIPAGEEAFAKREKVMRHYRKLLFQRAAGYTATVSAQDILALEYTPEKAQQFADAGQNAEDYIAYKKGLADTAQKITASRSWRITAPLRAIPRALAVLCGGLASVAQRLADWAGPKRPNIEAGDPAELNDFIFKTRRSFSWRVGNFLARLLGGG